MQCFHRRRRTVPSRTTDGAVSNDRKDSCPESEWETRVRAAAATGAREGLVVMPRNPWLAIDAATSPALRAREVRREWEQFVSDGRVNGVRAPVADSWQRSLDAGVDPSGTR